MNIVFRYAKLAVLLALVWFLVACGASHSEPEKGSNPSSVTKAEVTEQKKDETKPSTQNIGSEWEQLVAAAKKEGKLVIASAPSEIYRKALVTPFEEKFPGIKIEYTGINGGDFWPRVMQERKLGQYLWDVSIIGVSAIGWDKARELNEPIRPLLLPENAEGSKWSGGLEGLFMDKTQMYVPGFLGYSQSTMAVNRDFIPESEFSSPDQLLDPKFKGKIVILDPRSGAGLGSLAVLLAHYGEDFVRSLLTKQDLVVTKDNRQLIEWVVRGRYPIGIGSDGTNLPLFQQQGVGLNVKEINQGPMKLSRGFGTMTLLKNAPHPNAAKLYINWVLSKEGQQFVTKLLELNSRRLDVPPVDKESAVDPSQLKRFIPHQDEALAETRTLAQNLAKDLIK